MTKEQSKWPESVRLKMIEKSELYQPNEKVYQFGFYDGYQHQSLPITQLITAAREAKKDLQAVIDASPTPDNWQEIAKVIINIGNGLKPFDK